MRKRSLATGLMVGAALSLLLAGVGLAQGSAAKKGSSVVNVYSCKQDGDDIFIQHKKNTPAFKLPAGCRDAGYGLRDYALTCVSDKKYKVDWVSCATVGQAAIAKLTVSGQDGAALGIANSSYQTLKYYAAKQLLSVPAASSQVKFALELKNTTSTGNYTYGYAWVDKPNSLTNFNQGLAVTLSKNMSFSSSATYNLNLTDFYRGKFITFLVFMRDNDGVSRVPNMPVEVDDVIAVHLQVPVELKCENLSGGDGIYNLCQGKTLTHNSSSTVSFSAWAGNSVALSLNGGSATVIAGPGKTVSFLSPNGQTKLDVTVMKVMKTDQFVTLRVTSHPVPAEPVVKQISLSQLAAMKFVTVVDFEDPSVDVMTKWKTDAGLWFSSTGGKVTFWDEMAWSGGSNAIGRYAIMNYAEPPKSSAGDPLVVNMDKGAAAVGFYLGNGVSGGAKATATIKVYGKDGQTLGTFTRQPGNQVNTFIALLALPTEPIYKVTVDYGASALYEAMDNFMYVPATVTIL